MAGDQERLFKIKKHNNLSGTWKSNINQWFERESFYCKLRFFVCVSHKQPLYFSKIRKGTLYIYKSSLAPSRN